MSVLVTDAGFGPENWKNGLVPLAALSDQPCNIGPVAVDLSSPELSGRDWAQLRHHLPRLSMVRVHLRHFGDTASLDLARALRAQGFAGRIRAHGAVLARLYTLLRRAGFDEVELDREQARRQPAEHWQFESLWRPQPALAPPTH